VTTSPDIDITASRRQAAESAGCHHEGWFALDKIARVLTKRVGTGRLMPLVNTFLSCVMDLRLISTSSS
jgi:hypothetical protein